MVADMERWLDGQGRDAAEAAQQQQAEQEAEQLLQVLRQCRFPLSSKRDQLTIPSIIARYARRMRLVTPALDAQSSYQQRSEQARAEDEPEVEVEEEEQQAEVGHAATASSAALRSAVWAYQQLVASPLSTTPEGIPLVFSLLDELHAALVQPVRAAQRRRKQREEEGGGSRQAKQAVEALAAAGGLQRLEDLADAFLMQLLTAVNERVQTRRRDRAMQELVRARAREARDTAVAATASRKLQQA